MVTIQHHCCPEFSERTARKWLIYKGFSDILGGVDLNSVTPDEAISRADVPIVTDERLSTVVSGYTLKDPVAAAVFEKPQTGT
jgi:hypothetical protein